MSKFAIYFIALLIISFSGCKSGHDYPPEVIQNFMNSCRAGSSQKTCSCLLKKVQAKYTFEEFSAIDTKIKTGQAAPEFLDWAGKARADCMSETGTQQNP